jgi:hypothetical protein
MQSMSPRRPKKLTFKDEGKIREPARRGEAWQTSEDRQMLDYAIAKGEGGVDRLPTTLRGQ